MATDTLADRICSRPILPNQVSLTIDTMTNLDGDFDGHCDGEATCKQTLRSNLSTLKAFVS